MRKDKTILCPINFTESSNDALQYAVKMARKEHMDVTVLYSYRLIQQEKDERILDFKRKTEENAHEKFKKLEQIFDGKNKVAHKLLVEIGFLSDNIVGHISKNNISMLVIDRTLYRLLNDHNAGTSSDLLVNLGIPVIIVPEAKAVLK